MLLNIYIVDVLVILQSKAKIIAQSLDWTIISSKVFSGIRIFKKNSVQVLDGSELNDCRADKMITSVYSKQIIMIARVVP